MEPIRQVPGDGIVRPPRQDRLVDNDALEAAIRRHPAGRRLCRRSASNEPVRMATVRELFPLPRAEESPVVSN